MTTSKYWGGSSVRTSDIRPLDIENFKQLVDRQINVPVVLPLTREAFFAKTADERNRLKNVAYITPCSFVEGTTERKDANAHQLTTLFFDFDDGTDVKLFNEGPDVVGEMLWPFSYALYHTASSTPEAPRMRLMVDIVPCDTKSHRKLVRYVVGRLGLSKTFKGLRESTVTSQPMFRPVSFLGSEHISPVVSSRTNGQALNVADVPEEEPDVTGKPDFTYDGDFGDTEYGLAFLPIYGLTVEDVTPILDHISPDIEFPFWSMVFTAFRHQFRKADEAEDAFNLLVNWSSGSDKYKEWEPATKWKSFTPDPKGKLPVTIRSFFKLAIESGWKPEKLETKVKQSIADRILECEDGSVLLAEGSKWIIGMVSPNSAIEDYLVGILRDTLIARGFKVDKASLKKQVAAEKLKKRAEQASSEPPKWLRPFYYISSTNKFRNAITGTEMIPEAFDNNFSLELISTDKESESAMSGRPSVLPRYFALNQIQIGRVDETIYSPLHGANADSIVVLNGKKYLNTYLTSSCPLEDPSRSDEAGKLFCEHIAVLIAEPEYREILIDYIAHNVQFPGVKIPWAAIIQSAEGVGKGFLGRMLMGVFGKQNVKVISPEILKSQWNDYQVGAMFAILDEVHIPGEHRERVMNAIKMAIADTTVPINKRNTSAGDAPNTTNYISFSNFIDALHLKPTDRRWMVIYSAIQTERQVLELNASGHFERMEPLLGELSGALRHWLMNRKISDSFPKHGPAPKTKYRDAVIELSKNPLLVFIEKLIESDEHPLIGDDVIHLTRFEATVAYEARASAKPTKYLTDLGYEKHGTADIAGERTEIWLNPRNFHPELGTPEELLESRISENIN